MKNKRVLRILDKSGDTEVDLVQDFDLAEELFGKYIKEGRMAYEVTDRGNKQIFELNSDVKEVILIQAQAGG